MSPSACNAMFSLQRLIGEIAVDRVEGVHDNFAD